MSAADECNASTSDHPDIASQQLPAGQEEPVSFGEHADYANLGTMSPRLQRPIERRRATAIDDAPG